MIERRPDLEVKFYGVMRESFGAQAREGVHLSGLLSPRREFWQHAIPMALTNAELGYFIAGRGHEDILDRLLVQDFQATAEALIDGIYLRPDFIAITDRVIPVGAHAEFKTRRSNLPANDDMAQTELSSYRAQVRGYMALKRQTEMYLIVLSLTEGKTGDPLSRSEPVFALYRETATDEELERERAKLQARKTALTAALDAHCQGDTAALDLALLLLPLCEPWLCGKPMPEMVKAPVCLTCDLVFKSAEFGPQKHVESKSGRGHVVQPAVMLWKYVPRCKWYEHCRPQDVDQTRGER